MISGRKQRRSIVQFSTVEQGLLMRMAAASAPTAGQPSAIPIEDLLRKLIPQVLATVFRRFHDFPGADDAVQEAALSATMQWPREGMPGRSRLAQPGRIPLDGRSSSQRFCTPPSRERICPASRPSVGIDARLAGASRR